ncbi:MAG: ABC transporter ATP-binding protein [Methanoregula sp.]|jgi:iron complex transport system ATP-binding protein|uniref:ABC transporter ATP-binding protein n=1 Tax=Methanoregula sp. TaxID=2052170 RepID=UPI0025F832FD|nr:ABC transporter ATP-binding protein [Methanoregula sp.]MCK9632653.1 ABC transporter ATP-binding protein [Methanoregula sp.]
MNDGFSLNAENLHAGYDTEDIVKAVSCSFAAGTFTGIIGPNGSGKTTLLRAFSRVLPSSGILELDGKALTEYSPAELGMALGFVPQDEGRPFSYTVMQVVLMARYARTSRFSSLTPADYARCHTVLEETGISHLQDRSIRALSGGEWQRVLIARALAQDTKVLLLDEPTSHLDLSHQSDVLSLMKDLAGAGSTIIGVFHDLNLAALYCDRLIMIKDGMLVADGTPADVLTPEKIRGVYGAVVVAACHPATGRTFLMPLSARSRKNLGVRETPLRVLVVSGGGSGADLLHFLSGRGYDLSAGILATTDMDYRAARALEIPCIPVLPFSQIPAHSLEKLRRMAAKADRIVLPMHPVGTGNLPALSVLRESDPFKVIVHLPEGREYTSYDFARGAAAAAMTDLCTAGASCTSTYDGILLFLEQPDNKIPPLSE